MRYNTEDQNLRSKIVSDSSFKINAKLIIGDKAINGFLQLLPSMNKALVDNNKKYFCCGSILSEVYNIQLILQEMKLFKK